MHIRAGIEANSIVVPTRVDVHNANDGFNQVGSEAVYTRP